jgi:hypothetical protein
MLSEERAALKAMLVRSRSIPFTIPLPIPARLFAIKKAPEGTGA